MNNENNKGCLYCDEIIVGRTDKKFCNVHCKANYHNKSINSKEIFIRKLNQNLRRNRSILQKLCPMGKATVRKSILEDLGFDFGCFTSIYPTSKQTYYLEYDYGFSPLVDKIGVEKVLIIQKQDYMGALNPWKYLKK